MIVDIMTYLALVKNDTTIPITIVTGIIFFFELKTLRSIPINIGKEIPSEFKFIQLQIEKQRRSSRNIIPPKVT